MKIEFEDAKPRRVEINEAIILNGKVRGRLSASDYEGAKYYAQLKVEPLTHYCGGFGDTKEDAVQDAVLTLQKQVDCMQQFLQEVQA